MNQGTKKNLRKEIRRRTFVKRAARQKKKWFSAACKRKSIGKTAKDMRWKRIFGQVCSFCFWLGLGALMLAVSWQLFWRTGKVSFSEKHFEQNVPIEQEDSRVNREEEGWSQEIFGMEIRIRDGKIIFFREKEGREKLREQK